MTAGRQRLGAAGEERAARWYLAQGYEVVARNWRCRDGELDLILARARTIVVCEVKTRLSRRAGDPLEAVTARKARRLRELADQWLVERGSDLGGVLAEGGGGGVKVRKYI